jgi:hypothetical protein
MSTPSTHPPARTQRRDRTHWLYVAVVVAVALGVLVDTLVVRPLLVPAVVTLLGDRTWWPRRTSPPS